jgi:hypothetical protein
MHLYKCPVLTDKTLSQCTSACAQAKAERLLWLRALKPRVSMRKGGRKKAAAAGKKPAAAAADGSASSSSSSKKSKSSSAAAAKRAAAAALDADAPSDASSVGEPKESQYVYLDDDGGADSDGVCIYSRYYSTYV